MGQTTETIGKHLRKIRRDQGLSLERVSLMLGIDRSYLGRIETGKVNVSVEKLEAITECYGLTLFEFFDSMRG